MMIYDLCSCKDESLCILCGFRARIKELESISETLNKVYQTSLETNKKQAQCIREQREEIELIKSKNEFLSKCVDSREQKLVKLEAEVARLAGLLEPLK